jgi:hypothetical protein
MDPWPRFVTDVLARHGVADVRLAADHGISADRFLRRTAREGWERPARGVRVHPAATESVQRSLLTVCRSSSDVAAAAGETAAWLHGLRERPPDPNSVLVRHATRCAQHPEVVQRRARWLRAEDVVELEGVPVLRVPAMLVSSLGTPMPEQRARIIDVIHRGLATDDEVGTLLARIGPVTGKGVLRRTWTELEASRHESVLNLDVRDELHRLGYGPAPGPRRIPTPDGIGVTPDVPLPWWRIGVDPEGDSYHRTREQRRKDRRRVAAYAATDWAHYPIDWRDWHHDRDHVMDGLDDAIVAQQRRGIGVDHPRPRRPGGRRVTARAGRPSRR